MDAEPKRPPPPKSYVPLVLLDGPPELPPRPQAEGTPLKSDLVHNSIISFVYLLVFTCMAVVCFHSRGPLTASPITGVTGPYSTLLTPLLTRLTSPPSPLPLPLLLLLLSSSPSSCKAPSISRADSLKQRPEPPGNGTGIDGRRSKLGGA